MLKKIIISLVLVILTLGATPSLAKSITPICQQWTNVGGELADGKYQDWICTPLLGGLPADGINIICLTLDQNKQVQIISGAVQAGAVDSCKAVISKTGLTGFEDYIFWIYKILFGIIAIIAVIIIIFSSIQLSFAGIDTNLLAKAKAQIFYALGAVAFMSVIGTILHFINPIFFR